MCNGSSETSETRKREEKKSVALGVFFFSVSFSEISAFPTPNENLFSLYTFFFPLESEMNKIDRALRPTKPFENVSRNETRWPSLAGRSSQIVTLWGNLPKMAAR